MKEKLLKELVMRDFNALRMMVENVSFNDAYVKLGGFNLSADMGISKFGLEIDAYFDFNFGCLNGTIYYGDDGSAVVGYKFDVWLKDITTPIANVTAVDDEFNINEWYDWYEDVEDVVFEKQLVDAVLINGKWYQADTDLNVLL